MASKRDLEIIAKEFRVAHDQWDDADDVLDTLAIRIAQRLRGELGSRFNEQMFLVNCGVEPSEIGA